MKEFTAVQDRSESPNPETGSGRTRGRRQFTAAMLLSGALILMLYGSHAASAQQNLVKGKGTMTAVFQDSVVIDGKGFLITWTTKVFTMHNVRTRITDLKLPVLVRYEYVYTPQGPVIKKLSETGE